MTRRAIRRLACWLLGGHDPGVRVGAAYIVTGDGIMALALERCPTCGAKLIRELKIDPLPEPGEEHIIAIRHPADATGEAKP